MCVCVGGAFVCVCVSVVCVCGFFVGIRFSIFSGCLGICVCLVPTVYKCACVCVCECVYVFVCVCDMFV